MSLLKSMTNSAAYARPGIETKKYKNPVEEIREILISMGISWDKVIQNNRTKQAIDLRQTIHAVLRNNTEMTLEEIGIMVGRKDHCTVLFSVKSIENDKFVFKRTGAISEKLQLYNTIETKFKEVTKGELKYW